MEVTSPAKRKREDQDETLNIEDEMQDETVNIEDEMRAVVAQKAAQRGFSVVESRTMPLDRSRLPLKDALQAVFPERYGTPSSARKAVRRGVIMVGDRVATCEWSVEPGQLISYIERSQVKQLPQSAEGQVKLQVVFEDMDIGILVKPQGLNTNHGESSLQKLLHHNLIPTTSPHGVLPWPRLVSITHLACMVYVAPSPTPYDI